MERRLGISYEQARKLGRAYDAAHGKPKRIVRRLGDEDKQTGRRTIPVRELRNDSAKILRQVEQGRRFVVTVSGRQVAELIPFDSRSAFVPASVIRAILEEAPLDRAFARDLRTALSQRVDEI